MNFVKLYIGDYLRDTGTLTLAQHGAYALMLLEFYATEKPLPAGRELHRLLRADSKAEREAIDFVAAKFWHQTEVGLSNPRGVKEIERAAHQRAVNQEIGKRGGRPKGSERRTESETESVSETEANRNPNHSHSQTLPTSDEVGKARKRATHPSRPDDVDAQVWTDWLALRKAKRAPVTETVVESANREAQAAGMTLEAFLRVWCARGSQGLQADWLKPNERVTSGPGAMSKPDRIALHNIAVVREFAKGGA